MSSFHPFHSTLYNVPLYIAIEIYILFSHIIIESVVKAVGSAHTGPTFRVDEK